MLQIGIVLGIAMSSFLVFGTVRVGMRCDVTEENRVCVGYVVVVICRFRIDLMFMTRRQDVIFFVLC